MNADTLQDFLSKSNIFAVVGASNNPEKYGYKVYKDLKAGGYQVYPVNPEAEDIQGNECYPDLQSLPAKPDVVDTVVPPGITEQIARACHENGIKKIWMQPGSESEAAIAFCEANGIAVVHSVCVMIERRKTPGA